jgi:hypothetical protein
MISNGFSKPKISPPSPVGMTSTERFRLRDIVELFDFFVREVDDFEIGDDAFFGYGFGEYCHKKRREC